MIAISNLITDNKLSFKKLGKLNIKHKKIGIKTTLIVDFTQLWFR